MNDIYYKIYQSSRLNELITVVCMQWFDECDYDKERFLTDEEGNALKFDTEENAKRWLNENVRTEMIDPDYRKIKFSRSRCLKQRFLP
ncbi:hypothetical protein MOC30_14360 [Bacillus spizizenii]|nr:hypothetical protein [Bacillus spizizenii]